MTLQQIKIAIEQKVIGDELVIFQYEDVPFVADQYIREISSIRNLPLQYIESLDDISSGAADIFGLSDMEDGIRVYRANDVETIPEKVKYEKNLYIVVHKIKDKQSAKVLESSIVNIPKLEGWQLQDYVYSIAEGVELKSLDWLISATDSDIYRIENELDKFRLFSESERKFLFEDMIVEGAFKDLSSYNVFNITNAITSRDIVSLKSALAEIKSFDAEPLGVVTLLYQGFKKLISVWLAKSPTPESTGLKSNVIYAISKQPRCYTSEQLLNAFLLLTDIDRRLKTGDIDTRWLIDYLVCRILTF